MREKCVSCVLTNNKHIFCQRAPAFFFCITTHTHTHNTDCTHLQYDQGTHIVAYIKEYSTPQGDWIPCSSVCSMHEPPPKTEVSHHTLLTRDKLSISNSSEWLLVPHSGFFELPKDHWEASKGPPVNQEWFTHLTAGLVNAHYDDDFLRGFQSPQCTAMVLYCYTCVQTCSHMFAS